MAERAKGRFDIETRPEGVFAEGVGRMSITKTFHGDLQASSEGEMLAARTATPGSAGYVLIERVTGTLAGRTGSFMLQHFGLMQAGRDNQHTVAVIPHSGTGGLAGRHDVDHVGRRPRLRVRLQPGLNLARQRRSRLRLI